MELLSSAAFLVSSKVNSDLTGTVVEANAISSNVWAKPFQSPLLKACVGWYVSLLDVIVEWIRSSILAWCSPEVAWGGLGVARREVSS